MKLLVELDRIQAEEFGLIPRSLNNSDRRAKALPLKDGRQLYESYISQPRVNGGVKPKTAKKYRSVFDKFIAYLKETLGVTTWNAVDASVVYKYVEHLEKKGYAHKSQKNEITTIKQTRKWLTDEKHLVGVTPLLVKTLRAESVPAYCYKPNEVTAIISYCQANKNLEWLENVIIALACTGLWISELVSLLWTDIDLELGILKVTIQR